MTLPEQRKFKRQIFLVVLAASLPFIFVVGGQALANHYKLQNVEQNTITREQFIKDWAQLRLDLDEKNRVFEHMALSNKDDVKELKDQYIRLDNKIDGLRRDLNAVRGVVMKPSDTIVK